MGPWPACLVLLLPLTLCFDREAITVQRAAGEQFVATLCSNSTKQNETIDIIVLIMCSIRTQSRGDCRLVYRHDKGFELNCSSRFKLTADNHTIFLSVSSLTAEDSGNYSCQCSHLTGTTSLQFNVTVEDNEDASTGTGHKKLILVLTSVCCVTTCIIVTGLFLGCCLRRSSQRLTVLPNTESEEVEPYDTFIQRENELYSDAAVTQMYM